MTAPMSGHIVATALHHYAGLNYPGTDAPRPPTTAAASPTPSSGKSPFRPHVVADRTIYSGQNPQSSGHLARRVVADLSAQSPSRVAVRH